MSRYESLWVVMGRYRSLWVVILLATSMSADDIYPVQ